MGPQIIPILNHASIKLSPPLSNKKCHLDMKKYVHIKRK